MVKLNRKFVYKNRGSGEVYCQSTSPAISGINETGRNNGTGDREDLFVLAVIIDEERHSHVQDTWNNVASALHTRQALYSPIQVFRKEYK